MVLYRSITSEAVRWMSSAGLVWLVSARALLLFLSSNGSLHYLGRSRHRLSFPWTCIVCAARCIAVPAAIKGPVGGVGWWSWWAATRLHKQFMESSCSLPRPPPDAANKTFYSCCDCNTFGCMHDVCSGKWGPVSAVIWMVWWSIWWREEQRCLCVDEPPQSCRRRHSPHRLLYNTSIFSIVML